MALIFEISLSLFILIIIIIINVKNELNLMKKAI